MIITMTNDEVVNAITRYLKANAAVDVHDIDFTATRKNGGGVIADVNVSIINSDVESVIEVPPVEFESKEEETHEQQLEMDFESDNKELLDESFKEAMEPKEEEVVDNAEEESEHSSLEELDQAITASIESPIGPEVPSLSFVLDEEGDNSLPEKEVAPLPNLADMFN